MSKALGLGPSEFPGWKNHVKLDPPVFHPQAGLSGVIHSVGQLAIAQLQGGNASNHSAAIKTEWTSLGSAGQKPPSLQDPALCTSSSVSRLLISSVDWLSFSSSPWWRKGTEKKTSGMLVFDFHCDSAPKSAQLLWSVCRKRNQSILIVKENSCASAGRTNECQHFWNPFLDRGLFENDLRFQEFVFS